MSTADKENLISFLRNFGAIGGKVPGDAPATPTDWNIIMAWSQPNPKEK